jgi:hypothetical protein
VLSKGAYPAEKSNLLFAKLAGNNTIRLLEMRSAEDELIGRNVIREAHDGVSPALLAARDELQKMQVRNRLERQLEARRDLQRQQDRTAEGMEDERDGELTGKAKVQYPVLLRLHVILRLTMCVCVCV